jgi:flagellin
MSDIAITASARQTLLSLSNTNSLFNRTQNRLTTGNKVNSVTDDAVAYFRAKSLSDRGNDISTSKTVIDQSISSVNAALTATQAADTLLKTLQGVLEGARGASLSQRTAATKQFTDIGKQLAQLVKDATYQGLNLLTSSTANLSTQFSERTAATLKIDGFNLAHSVATARSLFTGVGAFSAGGALKVSFVLGGKLNSSAGIKGFSLLTLSGTTGSNTASTVAAIFAASDNTISTAINHLRSISASLGVSVGILTARSDFSSNYSNALETGSGKLTLADLNSESANSQALTLRQNIGIQSLSLQGTANSSILSLLR